jgi:exodeoxyribonuclease VII large subunit
MPGPFQSDLPMAVPRRDIYTVSRLNREARALLEAGLPSLWISGELSNLSRPASGHWYFSLKDEDAQVRCAMFRQRNLAVRAVPRDGMQVLLRARVGLYEARGEFQLVVDHLEEAGEGELRRRFEALKLKLAAEGLFDAARKRPLPRFPRRVGIVTSASGAALRDVLHVLRRRFPTVPVLLYPVPVQGAGAAREIASMLGVADRRRDVDVLLLVRGGGSLEDLWAFNDETLARAIAEVGLPVICGIGHEVDFTIADFVADVRAPTPSAAAELAVPDAAACRDALGVAAGRLSSAAKRDLRRRQLALRHSADRIRRLHPAQAIRQRMQRLDEPRRRARREPPAGRSARAPRDEPHRDHRARLCHRDPRGGWRGAARSRRSTRRNGHRGAPRAGLVAGASPPVGRLVSGPSGARPACACAAGAASACPGDLRRDLPRCAGPRAPACP